MKKIYEEDHRKDNPGLHLLYVKCACTHLVLLDDCIKRLCDMSNLNLYDAIEALQAARNKLVDTNAAYADAQEILNSIKNIKAMEKEEEYLDE